MSAAHAGNDHKWPKRDAKAVTLHNNVGDEKYDKDILRCGYVQ